MIRKKHRTILRRLASSCALKKVERNREETKEYRKDIYTEEYLRKLGLNERQQKAVHHVKTTGKITNQELRELTDVVIRTASRDLEDLVRKGVLVKMGKTGRSTHYVLAGKLDTNRTNRT